MRAEYNSNNFTETTRWQAEFKSEASLSSSYHTHFIIHFSWKLLYTLYVLKCQVPSHSTKIGNCSIHTEGKANNGKIRLMHNIKHTNGKIECTWKLQMVHSHMERYLPPYHTELNFTASISVWLHPREQCWHGNCRLYAFLFFLISRYMNFLLASGSGKFRLIALFIWGKKQKRGFVWIHNQCCRREKQKHSLD